VRLAARGAREVPGGGAQPVGDPEAARVLRAQAARVHREALLAATLATLVALLAVAALA
jgi:hypothetical protein